MAVSVALLALGAACSDSDGPTDPDGPTTGTIAVSAATTGDDQDTNGYSVMLDGAERAAIGTNGSVNLSAVSPGTRSVSLSEVSGNCAVGGQHPRSVSVAAGATAQAAFGVSCVAAVGSIEVTVATTGDGTDPDGYFLLIDGQPSGTIDANASRTLADVSIGSRDVELGDVAPNCSVANDNPQAVDVPFEGTAAVSFDVQCTAPLAGTIAFGSRRTGRVEVFTWNGATGTVTQVTDSPEEGVDGDSGGYLLSPDGSKILYLADDGAWDLWVVNTDGTGQLRLTQNSEGGRYPSWSPDGSRIAFGKRSTDPGCAALQSECGIDMVNVDGTGRNALTDAGGRPVWSPDGSTILFLVGDPDSNQRHIWRVNADGTGLEQVTNSGFYSHVAYSPDGSRILHTYSPEVGMPGFIGVMNVDGSGQVSLGEGGEPTWSPDGSKIAFKADAEGGTCGTRLYVMNSDGTGTVPVTLEFCVQSPRGWSPDSQWIAFWSYPQSEIYIVPSDSSSDPVNITNQGADDWLGSWGP